MENKYSYEQYSKMCADIWDESQSKMLSPEEFEDMVKNNANELIMGYYGGKKEYRKYKIKERLSYLAPYVIVGVFILLTPNMKWYFQLPMSILLCMSICKIEQVLGLKVDW